MLWGKVSYIIGNMNMVRRQRYVMVGSAMHYARGDEMRRRKGRDVRSKSERGMRGVVGR